MKRILCLILLATSLAITACSDRTGPDPDTQIFQATVGIKFGKGSATVASRSAGSTLATVTSSAAQEPVISGTNGTLDITDIRMIVEDFVLRPVEVSDCDVEPEPSECKNFETRYHLIDVPLIGAAITVVQENIPAGLYDQLEFDVDDIEVEEDEVSDLVLVGVLARGIFIEFPDWPEKASMVVVGSFTPTGESDAQDFRAYFEAEIEVELDLIPSLEVTGEGLIRNLIIEVSPERWFLQADGTVLDLASLDFARTGLLIDFDPEIKDGFDLQIEN